MVLAGTASFTDRLLLRLFQFYVNHWKEEVKANRSPTLLPYQEQGFEWHFQCSPLKYLERPAPNRRFLTCPSCPGTGTLNMQQKLCRTPMFVSNQSALPSDPTDLLLWELKMHGYTEGSDHCFCRTTESFGLEEPAEIFKSTCSPSTTKATSISCPQVPHPHGF